MTHELLLFTRTPPPHPPSMRDIKGTKVPMSAYIIRDIWTSSTSGTSRGGKSKRSERPSAPSTGGAPDPFEGAPGRREQTATPPSPLPPPAPGATPLTPWPSPRSRPWAPSLPLPAGEPGPPRSTPWTPPALPTERPWCRGDVAPRRLPQGHANRALCRSKLRFGTGLRSQLDRETDASRPTQSASRRTIGARPKLAGARREVAS